MKAETIQDDFVWSQVYHQGVPQTEVIRERPIQDGETSGITITFTPDFTILAPNTFNYLKLVDRARELAYIVRGLSVTVRDERENPPVEVTLHHANGLADLVRHLSHGKATLHEPVIGSCEVTVQNGERPPYTVLVDFAFQYTDSMELIERSYVNTVETREGGSHVLALRSAITNVINDDSLFDLDDPAEVSPFEATRGLVAAISVFHPMPQFVSPTKVKLLVPAELYGAVSQAVFKTFLKAMEDHETARLIIEKCRANRAALRETR